MGRFWKGSACAMMLSLQFACSSLQPSATLPRAHYDPAYLNEAAIAALATGERGTAAILLERAAVLAPQDALIRDNLAALRRGGVVRSVSALPAQTRSASAPMTTASPSALPRPEAATAVEQVLPAMRIWPQNDGVALPAPAR